MGHSAYQGLVGELHLGNALVQRLGRLAEGLFEMDGVAQRLAIGLELGPFSGLGRELLQVRQGLRQLLQTLLAFGLAAAPGFQGGLGLAHGGGLGLQTGLDPEHLIDERQVPLLTQQGLVIVLAGEAHPEATGIPQIRQGAAGPVDPGPAAGPHFAAQHHGLLVWQAALRQEGPPDFEAAFHDGFHRGPLRTVAHQLRVAPGAHQQGQRVHQQGLARAGLAREHREARPPIQGQIFHQGQILDSQG